YHSGDRYYRSHGGGGNVNWCQTVCAAICALLWGEASGRDDWREVVQHGIEYSRCYLAWGTDAGGFSYEGTGYGHSVFAYMFIFVELLVTAGHADLYASEPRLRQVAEASLQRLFPDGSY